MSGKTRKLIATMDFQYGDKIHKAEAEFLAAVEDVENLVSRGLAYVKGQTPIPMNSGMQDPINPAKEQKQKELVKLHLNADPGSAGEATGTNSDGGQVTAQSPEPPVDPPAPTEPPVEPPAPVDPPEEPPIDPSTPTDPGVEPQGADPSAQPEQ